MAHLCKDTGELPEFRHQETQKQILVPNSGCKSYVAGWTISLPGLPQPVARQPRSSDKPLFDILEISVYFISLPIGSPTSTTAGIKNTGKGRFNAAAALYF